jgi:hypothetical protein
MTTSRCDSGTDVGIIPAMTSTSDSRFLGCGLEVFVSLVEIETHDYVCCVFEIGTLVLLITRKWKGENDSYIPFERNSMVFAQVAQNSSPAKLRRCCLRCCYIERVECRITTPKQRGVR